MKKLLLAFILAMLLTTGCQKNSGQKIDTGDIKHSLQFFDTFDTLIEVTIFTEDEKFANENLNYAQKRFEELHKLFDRYHNYENLANIKTINDNGGKAPVVVNEDLYHLIDFSKKSYEEISHKTNICLGPVVDVWNEYRSLYEGGASPKEVEEKLGHKLPPMEELEKLRPLLNMDQLVLNPQEHSVYLMEEGMSLDTGAVAKGYATELVAKDLEERGVTSAMISAGGNIRIIGKPIDGRDQFRVGIQNPNLEEEDNIAVILDASETSVVTSGDYQRFFDLEGKRYCHILDPDTLYPAQGMKSMTVVTEDSGLCDFLSTSAFLSTEEEIMEMAKETKTAMYWIDEDFKSFWTPDMEKYLEDDHEK